MNMPTKQQALAASQRAEKAPSRSRYEIEKFEKLTTTFAQAYMEAMALLRKSHFAAAGISNDAASKKHGEYWKCEVCQMLAAYHAQEIGE